MMHREMLQFLLEVYRTHSTHWTLNPCYGLSQLALKPVPLQCLHETRPCIIRGKACQGLKQTSQKMLHILCHTAVYNQSLWSYVAPPALSYSTSLTPKKPRACNGKTACSDRLIAYILSMSSCIIYLPMEK